MGYDQTTDLCKRGNIGMAWTVEIAITMGDVAAAAEYLAECGVPFDVAQRVLLHPNRRRNIKL